MNTQKTPETPRSPPLTVHKVRTPRPSSPASPERVPPPSIRRDVSETFHIKLVERLASRPVKSPFIEEQLLRKVLPPTAEEPAEEPAAANTFVTYSGSVRQTWRCKDEPVGEGSFTKVYLTTDDRVAVKVAIIDEDDEDSRLRIQASLLRELEILQEISHPCITTLLGCESDLKHNQVRMAMPYYRGGDLFSFVVDHRAAMSERTAQVIFSNIVSALCYLHHNNICHRDIKPENVLLAYPAEEVLQDAGASLRHVAVLTDFGLSRKIDPDNPLLTTRCGSEDYVSPELLLSLKYDGKQNDCWSLGVLLYTILEARLPFDPIPGARSGRSAKPSHRIATISWSWYNLKGTDTDAQDNNFEAAKDIVNHLLVKRTKRWTIDEGASHRWCAEYCTVNNS